MITFKPQSILQLTITGFLAVSATLVVALVLTAKKLDGLSVTSQSIVTTTTEAMAYSRILIEQASAMERNTLQFEITGGQEILDVYNDRRKRLVQAVNSLRTISKSDELNNTLGQLLHHDALLSNAMSGQGNRPEADAIQDSLLSIAYRASENISDWNALRLVELGNDTERTKTLLTYQAIGFVGCALLMAAIFTALITRPLLQLERAIRLIGDGGLKEPIRVAGPTDLVNLGERLEWLRLRMEALEQRRSLFLRHISHELKTPLASMQESASLLRDGVAGPMTEEQCRLLDIQTKNSKRLLRLINDLLRHNSERFSLLNTPPESVRLDRLIEKVLSDNDPLLKSKNIMLVCEGPGVTVCGNFDQLRVILDNLLSNAIRFSPPAGTIRIITSATEQATQVDVIDQGPGIPPDEHEDIFVPFFQGKLARSDKQATSGLGLAIAMEYSHANEGRIEALESSTGAHFRLILPAPHTRSAVYEEL